ASAGPSRRLLNSPAKPRGLNSSACHQRARINPTIAVVAAMAATSPNTSVGSGVGKPSGWDDCACRWANPSAHTATNFATRSGTSSAISSAPKVFTATSPIRVWRQEADTRNKAAPIYTAKAPLMAMSALGCCIASNTIAGSRPHSNTQIPSAEPRRSVTKATVAGVSSGIQLPTTATAAARARLRSINSASARMGYVLLVAVRIGQQSQVARTLDSGRQLTLILGFGTGNTAGYDFTGFGDIGLQG